MTTSHEIRLFTFAGSNSGLTAELLLAHANVPHEVVQLRPGLHAASLKLRGFPGTTVPALQLDERKITGSRAISRVVADELAPATGLLPSDPDERALVLELEREGERLQKAVRRLFYAAAAGDPRGVEQLIARNFGMLPKVGQRVAARALMPAARYGHRVRVERGPAYVERIVELLAVAEDAVDAGHLGGDVPNVADFQFAPNIAALGEMSGPLGQYVRERRVWPAMRQIVPKYPVSFGIALPSAWLAGAFTS